MPKTAVERLEELRQSPFRWQAMNRAEVKEIMKSSGGFVHHYGKKYWVSFRPAWKRLSSFVFKQSSCKEGDYYVCLVDSRTHSPYREWE